MSSAAARNLAGSTARFLFNECQMHLRVLIRHDDSEYGNRRVVTPIRAISVRDQVSVPLRIPNLRTDRKNKRSPSTA